MPPEKTVPEGEAGSKGRVGLALQKSKERFSAAERDFTFQLLKQLGIGYTPRQ